MSKLCLIYNFAQRYREEIFSDIDKEWDCEWYFGINTTNIKGMDLSLLRDAHEVENVNIRKSAFFYQKGIFKLARRKDISTYFMLGDPHCLSNWLLAFYVKYFRRNKKVYFWTHGWYGKESRMTAFLKKRYFKMSDGIFLYGNYARGLMMDKGFDPDKLFVIHNSLHHTEQLKLRKQLSPSDVYTAHFKNDNPNIVFIGRLTAVKKLDLLLKAVSLLRDKGMGLNVTFIGDGSQKEELKNLTKELCLEENVWFYGACYDEKTNAELIYNADLCVAPGNVGLTAMHSMVFGTPVISHGDFNWQMPEFEAIQKGKTGDFFKPNDVKSLAAAIKNWFTEHPDREAVRKACYKEIDEGWTPEFQMEVLRENLKV